jgi:hypothetical protein
MITDRLVAVYLHVETQGCATTTLAYPELVLEPADNLPPPIRCYTFLLEHPGAWLYPD